MIKLVRDTMLLALTMLLIAPLAVPGDSTIALRNGVAGAVMATLSGGIGGILSLVALKGATKLAFIAKQTPAKSTP
jgi:hypothetical protein